MEHREQWIWLPEAAYPQYQTTPYHCAVKPDDSSYTVAHFRREYVFPRKIRSARLRFSADTVFRLYVNGAFLATGPACVGGDFYGNETRRENFYAFETLLEPDSEVLDFSAQVRMLPVQLCDYSKGHGGFMLSAILTFADGSCQQISTDESWLVRRCGGYIAPGRFDARLDTDPFLPAQLVPNIWNTATAPIPIRTEQTLTTAQSVMTLSPGEQKTAVLTFDRIWAGFLRVQAETAGEVQVRLSVRELEEAPRVETLVFSGDGDYRGFTLHSMGNLTVEAENSGLTPAKLTVSFLETHYPVTRTAQTLTDDEDLNRVLDTCRHTLMICRQTHHLDSPRHCEPMACTGDYYLETLMTPFSFGDLSLARFDLLRTAYMLERERGRMFHTTYSLIWVKMLWDVYCFTADLELVSRCRNALEALLERFQTYLGTNGLLETPPDYMFVDWIYVDGLSMHHPPKALGQTCLNLFYFAALDHGEKLFTLLEAPEKAASCARQREALRRSVNTLLFDEERQLYRMGLNTPTEEALLGTWMPRNTQKAYFMKHANILAAWSGICTPELARSLVDRVMDDTAEGDCQPYFLHYLLDAVYRLGLRERYTLSILEKWKQPVRECAKGLAEGFVKPEPTYSFDHSHAWGGTPLYSLPMALLGLTIDTPGMAKLTLSPALLGLKTASVELLTPFGKLTCRMEEGKKCVITAPEGVEVTVLETGC